MGAKAKLLLLLGAIANVAIASSNVLHPNCTDKCGDLSNIPYPFGIGPGCFKKGFEVACLEKDGVQTPIFVMDEQNVNAMDISLPQGQARMYMDLGYICYNKSGGIIDQQLPAVNLSSTPYLFSTARNTFTVIGCNIAAYIYGEFRDSFYRPLFSNGCMSSCFSQDSLTEINGYCTGQGCCQTSLPNSLIFYMPQFPDNNSIPAFNESYMCSYAFVGDKDRFHFNYTYIYGTTFKDRYKNSVPVVLDWRLGSVNCSEAKTNMSTYECRSNHSGCVDSANGPGYLCNCSKGYQGNPYLLDGCQDIDECHLPEMYHCNATCTNMEGLYDCSCPLGEHSDGEKCVPDPNNNLPLWVKVALGASCGLVSLAIFSLLICMEGQKRKLSKEKKRFFQQNGGLILYDQMKSTGSNTFRIFRKEELQKATNMFDKNLILGHGGHGTVYRGILEGHVSVAIKKSRVIDESQKKEFVKEILILSQINHRNVVKILGCCLEVEVPMLVYEYVANGTLFDYIHGKYQKQPIPLDTRLRIAAESAEALAYLHSSASPPILHGDVKSSNILLDENHVAKVSDFGASTLLAMDEIQIATIVQGTIGYLDPEYMQTYIFTEKSDVYSFGVVILELLARKKAFYVDGSKEEKSLATIFLSLMKENRLLEFLDDQIMNDGYIEFIQEVSELVRQCLSIKGEERPTMKEVAEGLQTLRKLAQRPLEQLPSEELQSLLGESPTYDIVPDATRFYSFETRSKSQPMRLGESPTYDIVSDATRS